MAGRTRKRDAVHQVRVGNPSQGTGNGPAHRARWRARGLAIALLVGLALLIIPSDELSAQTLTTFVSNIGQTDGIGLAITDTEDVAQQFTTGTNGRGYKLTEVVVNNSISSTATPDFDLYTSTSGDRPGTKITDLSGSIAATGQQTFTPGSTTILRPSTKYFIRFGRDAGAGEPAGVIGTESNNEDSGGAAHWSISDGALFQSGTSWTSHDVAAEIAIKGTPNDGSTAGKRQPGIYGVERVGSTLHPHIGNMNDAKPSGVQGVFTSGSFKWQRSDPAAGTWTNISGATSRTYTLQEADVGRQVRLRINNDNHISFAYPLNGTVRAATVPYITGMAATSTPTLAWNTYGAGEKIQFTVTFSGAVDVTGSPELLIHVGSKVKYATYESGSGATAIVFAYTVSEGEQDPDGVDIPPARGITRIVHEGWPDHGMTSLKLGAGDAIREKGETTNAILTNTSERKLQGLAAHRINGDPHALGSTLVSNLSAAPGPIPPFNINTDRMAQAFTTVGAATLRGVVVRGFFNSGSLVSINSDSSGSPGSSLRTLINPSDLTGSTSVEKNHQFRAGTPDLTLAANTTYWVVVHGPPPPPTTAQTAEDGAPGWSIEDNFWYRISGTWTAGSPVRVMKMAVQGFHKTKPPDPPRVTGVSITPAGRDCFYSPGEPVDVTLTFSEAVTVDRTGGIPALELKLGTTDARSAAYLSGSGTTKLVFRYTITDDDGKNTSMFVTRDSLALNGGTIRSQARTHNMDADLRHSYAGIGQPNDVCRARPNVSLLLVRNLAGVVDGYESIGQTSLRAQSFTTGTEGMLRAVKLIGNDLGSATRVSVYSDNSGQPGTSLLVLQNPSDIGVEPGTYEFSSSVNALALTPLTTYWVVAEGEGDIARTLNTDEDGLTGWSLGDRMWTKTGGASWSELSSAHAMQIEVRGTGGKPTIVGAPAVTRAGYDGAWKGGRDVVYVTLTFSEAVTVKGRPSLEIRLSDTEARTVNHLLSSNGKSRLVFRYISPGADGLHTYLTVSPNSLRLNGGEIFSTASDVDADLSHLGTDAGEQVLVGTLRSLDPNSTGFDNKFASDTSNMIAARLRTGSSGATLSTVSIRGRFTTSSRVAIYSDNSGTPGGRLATLRTPGGLTSAESDTRQHRFRAPPEGVALAANTTYWVTYEGAGRLDFTSLADEYGLSGWSIGNNHVIYLVSEHGTQWEPSEITRVMLMEVMGKPSDGWQSVASNAEAQGAPPDPDEGKPFTARFEKLPEHHDGATAFTFEIHFSREPDELSYLTVMEGLVYVEGASLTYARRLVGGSNLGWELTVEPTQNGDITIRLPWRSCTDTASVCAGGRTLAEGLWETVSAAGSSSTNPANTEATGGPGIDGSAVVGQTLTATTSGIADEDGLTNAVFAYQWIRQDLSTAVAEEIDGATGSTYTVTAEDEGHVLMVVVSFTDDAGNEESPSSRPVEVTAAQESDTKDSGEGNSEQQVSNTPATGAPGINGSPVAGQDLTATTSGIQDDDGITNAVFAYQWLADDTAIESAAAATYTAADGDVGKALKVRVTFTDDAGNEESVTSAATAAVTKPLKAAVHQAPESHDGNAAFTFELRFSEEPKTGFSYVTLRDHALVVTGGTATKAQRLEAGKNARWEITVQPSGNADVTMSLPVTTDCAADGAICTGDGRMLSAGVELVTPGPPNSAATGAPTISGTSRVGETLTAITSGISDGDGLTKASYTYQWVSNDGTSDSDIADAAASAYALAAADAGKTIRVRVTFTDDGGNEETLTSAATAAVTAVAPGTPGDLSVSVNDTGKLDLSWNAPTSNGGSAITGYKVQWKEAAGRWDTAEDVSETTVAGTSHTVSGLADGTEYTFRLVAVNSAGDSSASAEESGTPRDTTAPTVASAAVDGSVLTLTFNEDLTETPLPAATTFTVSVGGSQRGVDSVAISGSTLTLTLASAVTSTDAVTVSYAVPSEAAAARLKDLSDNAAQDFNDRAVTNDTAAARTPLTAGIHDQPTSHDGQSLFTFELRFSEEVTGLSYKTLRDHAFTVTGGEVTKASRLESGKNARWEITVTPDSAGDVTVVLPETMDCEAQGAVCTGDGRMLSERVELTVSGPGG